MKMMSIGHHNTSLTLVYIIHGSQDVPIDIPPPVFRNQDRDIPDTHILDHVLCKVPIHSPCESGKEKLKEDSWKDYPIPEDKLKGTTTEYEVDEIIK